MGLGIWSWDLPCGRRIYGHEGEVPGSNTWAFGTADGRRMVIMQHNLFYLNWDRWSDTVMPTYFSFWCDRIRIDNLPADCCVEVPCVASSGGIEPQAVGALPRQLAALMQTNINVQGLTVDAALTGRAVHHAATLDPHTGAELSLDEIHSLVDDLLEAHGEMIPPLTGREVAIAHGQRAPT